MYTLIDDRSIMGKEFRACVVETLQELMKIDDKVVALEADLGGASGFTKIQKTNPDRFVQCGIAEANMMGVGAGLSIMGYKPFMHTFGPFATRRAYDQIFLSGGYAHNTLNIYGSDPGFTAAANGGTHNTWEDIALMRAIPNAVVCDAADEVQMKWIIKEFSKLSGIHYVRASRKAARKIYTDNSTFEIGKGNILKEGKDVLIISAGQLVSEALDCAISLEKQGISAEVIDMFCIKPIDRDLILSEAKTKKLVMTLENHSIIGGLGSAVAEVIAENGIAVKFKRIGMNDRFGEVGTADWLQKKFKLTAEDLEAEIKKIYNI